MKYLIEKDKRKRYKVKQFEKRRLLLKTISRTEHLPRRIQWKARLKLSKLPRNGSSVRTHNRCVMTGRSKAVYNIFKISRIKFRELASSGLIPGVKKVSW